MQNNIVLSFVQETLQRLFTKSPLFFRIWTLVAAVLVIITGLPDFINWLGVFNFHIPDLWSDKVNEAVAWASRAALIMTALTTQSKPVAVDEKGELLKKTNEKRLPFTAQSEQKIAVKNNGITSVVSAPKPTE